MGILPVFLHKKAPVKPSARGRVVRPEPGFTVVLLL